MAITTIRFDDEQFGNWLNAIHRLADAIMLVAHGPTGAFAGEPKPYAAGLEGLAMALAGEGLQNPVGDVLRELMDVMEERSKK